jgi:hypothetical protein
MSKGIKRADESYDPKKDNGRKKIMDALEEFRQVLWDDTKVNDKDEHKLRRSLFQDVDDAISQAIQKYFKYSRMPEQSFDEGSENGTKYVPLKVSVAFKDLSEDDEVEPIYIKVPAKDYENSELDISGKVQDYLGMTVDDIDYREMSPREARKCDDWLLWTPEGLEEEHFAYFPEASGTWGDIKKASDAMSKAIWNDAASKGDERAKKRAYAAIDAISQAIEDYGGLN